MSSKSTRADVVRSKMAKTKLWNDKAFNKAKDNGGFVKYQIDTVKTDQGDKRELQRINNPIMISNAKKTFENNDTDTNKFAYLNTVTFDDGSTLTLRVAGQSKTLSKLLKKFGLTDEEIETAMKRAITAKNFESEKNAKFIKAEKGKKPKSRKRDNEAVLQAIDLNYSIFKSYKSKEEGYKIEGKSSKRSKMSLRERYERFKDKPEWKGKFMTYKTKDGKTSSTPQDAPKGKTSKWYIKSKRIAASNEALLKQVFEKLFPDESFDKQNVKAPTRTAKTEYISDSEEEEEDDEEAADNEEEEEEQPARRKRTKEVQEEEEEAEEEEEEKPTTRRKRRVIDEDEEEEEVADLNTLSKRVRNSREKARPSDEDAEDDVEGSAGKSDDE